MIQNSSAVQRGHTTAVEYQVQAEDQQSQAVQNWSSKQSNTQLRTCQ